MRSLFIYWKMPPAEAEAALAAARRWQAALRASHPGLQTALYLRGDAAPGDAGLRTLMETFALPDGVPPGLDATLLAAGDMALQALGAPRRHVEVFDRLGA